MTTEQRQLLELLKTFSLICEEHGLQYFLVGGTLLGAVRHQGFIPWDDDVDVAMPERDYRRFLALKDELPEGLVIQSQETDEQYPFLFGKLCDTRIPYDTAMPYGPRGLYIDVFSLVPLKKDSPLVRLGFNAVKVIDYVLQTRSGWTKNVPYKNKVAQLGFRIMNCFSSRNLRKMQHSFVDRARGNEDSNMLCSFGGAYKADKEIYPRQWFENSQLLSFEDAAFKVPCGWHTCLSRNYGDYMNLPSPEGQKPKHK